MRNLFYPPRHLFIGTIGLRHGSTVVISNTQDFSRIDGLALENRT